VLNFFDEHSVIVKKILQTHIFLEHSACFTAGWQILNICDGSVFTKNYFPNTQHALKKKFYQKTIKVAK
jgi:hypothetical protein